MFFFQIFFFVKENERWGPAPLTYRLRRQRKVTTRRNCWSRHPDTGVRKRKSWDTPRVNCAGPAIFSYVTVVEAVFFRNKYILEGHSFFFSQDARFEVRNEPRNPEGCKGDASHARAPRCVASTPSSTARSTKSRSENPMLAYFGKLRTHKC